MVRDIVLNRRVGCADLSEDGELGQQGDVGVASILRADGRTRGGACGENTLYVEVRVSVN